MTGYNPFSLQGKNILVTGASSGIGQATAIECSKMGAKMIITGRDAERLDKTYAQLYGEGHQQILTELTDSEQVQSLLEQFDRIDGLVLCAGKGMTLPFAFCTRDKFDDLFNIKY